TPALVPALFSSAARRALRRRGSLARSAAAGATRLEKLIEAANRCPEEQHVSHADTEIAATALATPAELAERLRGAAWDVLAEFSDNPEVARRLASSLTEGDAAGQLVGVVARRPPEAGC